MFQGVFAHIRAETHFQAAQVVAEGYAFAGFHVDAVLDGCRQIGADLGNGFQATISLIKLALLAR